MVRTETNDGSDAPSSPETFLRSATFEKIDIERQFRLEKVRAVYPELFEADGPPKEQLLGLVNQ